jgi:hypothetical protein
VLRLVNVISARQAITHKIFLYLFEKLSQQIHTVVKVKKHYKKNITKSLYFCTFSLSRALKFYTETGKSADNIPGDQRLENLCDCPREHGSVLPLHFSFPLGSGQ